MQRLLILQHRWNSQICISCRLENLTIHNINKGYSILMVTEKNNIVFIIGNVQIFYVLD